MNFFKKKKEVKEELNPLSKAKEISYKYNQLNECNEVLSAIEFNVWGILPCKIINSGIDINEVSEYIKKLAIKRKKEIEAELTQL